MHGSDRRSKMQVGIVGAGSIGTLFAYALSQTLDVHLLGRPGARPSAMRLEGVDRAIPVERDAAILARCDVILVTVKSYDTVAALEPLRGVVKREAVVVSLQNGLLAREAIDKALGDRIRLALAPTSEGAMRIASGIVRRAGRGTTTVGWAAGRSGNEWILEDLVHALATAGFTVRTAVPIEPSVWQKAVVNAGINPTTALAGVPNGALAGDGALYDRARRLAVEAAAVARASGIGFATDPLAALDATIAATAANRSSMLQDLDAGARTEIDAITGAIVTLGARLGIATPQSVRALDEVRARAKA